MKVFLTHFRCEGRSTPITILKILALAALLSGLIVSTVSAHATMVRSEPEDGENLDASPEQVTVWFSEELDSTSSLRVFDTERNQLDNGDGGVDLNDLDHLTMIVNLPSLPAGTYNVQWTATSAEDGDTSQGGFRFSVGSGVPLEEMATPPVNNVLIWFPSGVVIVSGILGLAWVILERRKESPAEAIQSTGEILE